MCGILGAISVERRSLPIEEDQFVGALDTIAHRGPDDWGVHWSDRRDVALGHRRLSIIDLSAAGHQPMSNEDGTVWIIYNGEVYNFAEIHDELVARGHVFRSRTDTEVIIHGYEEYGDAIVERLRGMFVFAIWDERKRRLMMARDRVGIKPLYYTLNAGVLAFASEIKPLLELPGVERALDTAALNEYLAFGQVYAPRTMFQGIHKFPAGHHGVMNASGGIDLTRYWTPYGRKIDIVGGSERDYEERLISLLDESIRLRMISDVPVGVFLSGGVDSTANVALMSRIGGGRVHTFTAGFDGQQEYDERPWARRAAEHFNTVHNEITITRRSLLDTLPELSYYLDEPTADPTTVPIFFLSKLARQHGAIVILNGDGADELFCGYRKYLRYLKIAPYWRAYGHLPGPARRLVASIAATAGVDGVAGDLVERAARGVDLYVGSTGALKGSKEFQEILGNGDGLYRAVKQGRRDFDAERRSGDYAEWLSYWGVRSEVEHTFLYRADRMGMANSIEIRVPFLDHHLVEFAMQIPQELKYRGGETKHILKHALEGIVPNEFLYRKKQGFCVPIREWAGDMMNDAILDGLPRIHSDWGGISKGFLDGISARLQPGSAENADGFLSWNLYSLATWYERWFR